MEIDLLARFIVGGILVLEAAEHLAMIGSRTARVFFLSPAWVILRYALIIATVVLCISICLGAK